MTPAKVYIIIVGSTKPPHWLPHFVLDSFLLQEIAYQTFINGVVASLHKHKKGIWPQVSLITPMGKYKISNKPKRKSAYVPLISFKKFPSEDMTPKRN